MSFPPMTPEDIIQVQQELEPVVGPQLAAIVAAFAKTAESAVIGTCRECPCDVCLSFRGGMAGMDAVLGDAG